MRHANWGQWPMTAMIALSVLAGSGRAATAADEAVSNEMLLKELRAMAQRAANCILMSLEPRFRRKIAVLPCVNAGL